MKLRINAKLAAIAMRIYDIKGVPGRSLLDDLLIDRATLLAEIDRLRGVLTEWRKWYSETPGYRTRAQLEALTDACLEGNAGKDGE